MVLQLPRLTNSLRDPFDIDRAYLHRKTLLQNLNLPSNANSLDESELARKIVYKWEEASPEVRQAYKQFIGAVVDLVGREVVSEEFREVTLAAYRLFSDQEEEDDSRKIAAKKYNFSLFYNRPFGISAAKLYLQSKVPHRWILYECLVNWVQERF